MKVAYIAGPYRSKTGSIHEVVQNIRNAEKVALKYWKMGYAVICPHKNTGLLDGSCDDSIWLQGGLELLKRSDVLVLMNNWTKSEGSIAEFSLAMSRNIEIIFDEERF